MENIVYDASGQLVSGSFMGDFLIEHDLVRKPVPTFRDHARAMPRADDFCAFALAENEVPT
jgi:hypothetical protein